MTKHLNDLKASKILFIICWVVYAASYIGRYNFTAAITDIVNKGFFTKSETGLISTVFFFCYFAGQFINGFLGDKLSPFKMVTIGMLLSALSNALMSIGSKYTFMSLIWGLNGFAQSMLWGPVLYMISNVLAEEHRYKAYFYISMTVPAGMILTYLVSFAMLKIANWRYVFLAASVILLLMTLVWFVVWGYTKKWLVDNDEETVEEKHDTEVEPRQQAGFAGLLVASGILIILIPTLIQGMLKDGIMTWVPTMIMESYNTTPTFSLLLTLFIPVVNILGIFLGIRLFERFNKDAVKTSVVFYLLTLIPLGVLAFTGRINIIIAFVMLAVTTSCMNAVNHLILTRMPILFVKYGRTSTVAGILNSTACMGAGLSGVGFGVLSENFGWSVTATSWIVLVVIATSVLFISYPIWKKFTGISSVGLD